MKLICYLKIIDVDYPGEGLIKYDPESSENGLTLFLAAEEIEGWTGPNWDLVPFEQHSSWVNNKYVTMIEYRETNPDRVVICPHYNYNGFSPYSRDMIKNKVVPIFLTMPLKTFEQNKDKHIEDFLKMENIHTYYAGDVVDALYDIHGDSSDDSGSSGDISAE